MVKFVNYIISLFPSAPVSLKLLLPFLILTLSAPNPTFGSPTTGLTSLEELIEVALKNNHDLISAEVMAQRYNSRATMVNDLVDPLMAYYYFEFPLSFEVEEKYFQDGRFGLKKRTRRFEDRVSMVKNLALWYENLSQDVRLQLVQKIKEEFYRLHYQDRIIATNEDTLRILDSLIELSLEQYAVGKVRQADILKLQTERTLQLANIIELKQKRVEQVANLNYFTSRSANQTVSPLVEPKLTSKTLPNVVNSFQTIVSGFSSKRPLLKGYNSLFYRFDALQRLVQMYVNTSVRTEAVKEAEYGLNYIKAKASDFSTRSIADLKTSHSSALKNQQLANLYDTMVLPQARQTFQATLADFKVGLTDLQSPLQALISLNRYQITAFNIQADYMADLSKLESLSGMTLFGPAMPSN